MNCTTLELPRIEAEKRLADYERAAADRPSAVTDVDRRIMRALKVGARGGRLIDIQQAIASGGVNRAGLPRLAFSRADRSITFWRQRRAGHDTATGGGRFYYGNRVGRRWDWSEEWKRTLGIATALDIPDGTFNVTYSDRTYKSLSPLIPLPLRPAGQLTGYFLLWEANWHPAPPVDPYLLRPMAGSLMEIVAEWDVSPIELAAVKAGMIA